MLQKTTATPCPDAKWNIGLYMILSFCLPIIGLGIIFWQCHLAPFGDSAFLMVDLNAQYLSFFAYYQQIFQEEQSIFYSFAKLIGGDLAGFLSYYLASPFNLLLLLFKAENLPFGITLVAFCKIGAAGVTSYLFFTSHHKGWQNLLCSTAYALMAYNLLYLQNILWIDGVIWLPILALGIDRVLAAKGSALYCIALAIGIFSNYYIGFVLCLFSVGYYLYCIMANCRKWSDIWHSGWRFACISILAGGMNAFLLLPTLHSLKGSSKTTLDLLAVPLLSANLRMRELIAHIIMPSTILPDVLSPLPNVFVGGLCFVASVCFFIHPRIHWRKKLVAFGLCLVLIASFYFTIPNYIWHGCAAPVCFSNRFAFVFSFFMLLFAQEFLVATPIWNKKTLMLLLLVANSASCVFYGLENYRNVPWGSTPAYQNFYRTNAPIITQIKNSAGDGFYRIEKNYNYTSNDALLLGYNGFSHYSSGEQLSTRTLPRAMGYTITEGLGRYISGSYLAADSFWGIQYRLSHSAPRTGWQDGGTQNNTQIAQNPYALPLAFVSAQNVANLALEDFAMQDMVSGILSTALDAPYSFTRTESTAPTLQNITYTPQEQGGLYEMTDPSAPALISYTFIAPETTNLYLIIHSQNFGAISKITCNGAGVAAYPTLTNFGAQFIQSVTAGQEITLEICVGQSFQASEITLFYDDITQLAKMTAALQENPVSLTNFNSDCFTLCGTIPAEEQGLLLTMPVQDGWHFSLHDANLVPIAVLDSITYLPLPAGDFTIEARYIPPYLHLGIGISIICVAFTLSFVWAEQLYLAKTKQTPDITQI